MSDDVLLIAWLVFCLLIVFAAMTHEHWLNRPTYKEEIIYRDYVREEFMPDTCVLTIKRTYSNGKVKIITKKISY